MVISVSEKQLSPVSWNAEISADEPTAVQAYVLNFPGWVLKVDGQRVETTSARPYGNVEFKVSGGLHEVELGWTETPLRMAADVVSLISLFLIFYLYFSGRRHATI